MIYLRPQGQKIYLRPQGTTLSHRVGERRGENCIQNPKLSTEALVPLITLSRLACSLRSLLGHSDHRTLFCKLSNRTFNICFSNGRTSRLTVVAASFYLGQLIGPHIFLIAMACCKQSRRRQPEPLRPSGHQSTCRCLLVCLGQQEQGQSMAGVAGLKHCRRSLAQHSKCP